MKTAFVNSAPDGSSVHQAKVSIPSDLRSAQWSALPTWIRERAFFMASVDRAEVLDAFRQTSEAFTRGEIGLAEARAQLRGHLDRLNYQPLPGQEGTIKDLGTIGRQNLVLETNLLQVNGFARWARQQSALEGFPAQRLVRFQDRKKKRNWKNRWDDALGRVTNAGASDATEMCALVNHPIWEVLSRWHTPYAPFDYNSGMGLEPEDRATAVSLGLLDDSPEVKAMMQPQDRGLNETLAATPEIKSTALRQALAQQLGGLAQWDGDSLRFTDPNGTRKYSAEDLAALYDQDLPDGIPQLQRDAILEFASNPGKFKEAGHTDQWEDLVRAWGRTLKGSSIDKATSPLGIAIEELSRLTPAQLTAYGYGGFR